MNQRAKPQFYLHHAYWVDPNFLPAQMENDLRALLPKKMTREIQEIFLSRCAEEAQYIKEIQVSTANTEIKNSMIDVANKADSLLVAMAALSKEASQLFSAHFDTLAFVQGMPVKLSKASVAARSDLTGGRFLGAVWDATTDLKNTAHYATKKVTPNRSATVTDLNASRLISRMCEVCITATGQLPPHSKGTWFPAFMEKLGQSPQLRMPCGLARVAKVVSDKKHSHSK